MQLVDSGIMSQNIYIVVNLHQTIAVTIFLKIIRWVQQFGLGSDRSCNTVQCTLYEAGPTWNPRNCLQIRQFSQEIQYHVFARKSR